MIKANELRIGNIVLYDDTVYPPNFILGKPIRLDWFPQEELFEIPENVPFAPILLTEKWLEKLGFERQQNMITNPIHLMNSGNEFPHGAIEFMFGKHKASVYLLENKYYYELGMSSGEITNEYFAKEIKSVHSLQNLYFALCGEELTIKE